MRKVVILGGEVERGPAVAVFYGGEEFRSDPRYLIEVTTIGGEV